MDDYTRVMIGMRSQLPLVKYNFAILTIITLAAMLFGIFRSNEPVTNIPRLIIFVLIASLLLGCFFYLLQRVLGRWQVRRTVVKQIKSSPAMQEEHVLTFSDEGYESASRFGNAKVKWAAFIKAIETNDDFLLYTTNKFSQFVPKRAFSSEQQLESVRSLIREKIGLKEIKA